MLRVFLLVLLCIGSVPLCLAQDIRTHVDARVRECRAEGVGCGWMKPGRLVVEFASATSDRTKSGVGVVRRGGKLEVWLQPGRYNVRAHPPGMLVSPAVIEVSGPQRAITLNSYHVMSSERGSGGGAASSTCKVTGCNGELCATEELASSCQWSPVFRCLSGRHCVASAEKGCEWRDLPSITRCIDRTLR